MLRLGVSQNGEVSVCWYYRSIMELPVGKKSQQHITENGSKAGGLPYNLENSFKFLKTALSLEGLKVFWDVPSFKRTA